MLSDVCLSDVCRVHPVSGRHVRPAGRLYGAYWLIGLGSAGLAQGCRCALPLQVWAGHIVAAARLQFVYLSLMVQKQLYRQEVSEWRFGLQKSSRIFPARSGSV